MKQINVRIRLFSIFSELSGKSEVHIIISEGSSVRDALSQLRNEIGSKAFEFILCPETKEIKGSCIILLNQRNIQYLNGLDTSLNNNDLLELIPPLSGG
jgi:sulfur-carrier protein